MSRLTRRTLLRMTATAGLALANGDMPVSYGAELVSMPPDEAPVPTGRVPEHEIALRRWLENMVWCHRYSQEEITAAVGLSAEETVQTLARWNIREDNRPRPAENGPLLVLPYPGGRHPRIGFLDGAVRPQRETKLSVFTPWDAHSYIVLDIPEAIWSNLGLTYLAHTHVPTIWDQQGVTLDAREWWPTPDGGWIAERRLPNGIQFGTRVLPAPDAVRMEMWLINGSDQLLSDLRVQNCVMLKGAVGFTDQDNANKRFLAPYAVCRSDEAARWIISAWVPNHRTWGNAPCPCLHSDPKFPDCAPGETQRLRGWLSFYEGADVQQELARIDAMGWQDQALEVLDHSNAVYGHVVDASAEKPLEARVTIVDSRQRAYHPRTASLAGTVERHEKGIERTTLGSDAESLGDVTSTLVSAHPFVVHLPAGTYTLRVDAGPEYRPIVETFQVEPRPGEPQYRTIRMPARAAR